jgi:ABC-type transport system involved in multi-copper enzyme maturation permease subunit
MANLIYMLLIGRLNRGLFFFSALFIALIQFLIIWIFTSFDYAPILEAILNQLPPQMRVLFNEQFMVQLSLSGAAAFGFNHPLVLFNLGIVAIALPSWHIAGEAESGILELHLSYPVKRQTLFTSLWLTVTCLLFLIILSGYFGSILALLLKSRLKFDLIFALLKIIINLWILFTVIMSMALWISVRSRDGGKAGTTGAAISLLFYFLFFLGSTWEIPGFIQQLNPFYYYQPQKLMFDQNSFLLNIGVLMGLIIVLFYGGYRQFKFRDVP